jgi:hypothetical protein
MIKLGKNKKNKNKNKKKEKRLRCGPSLPSVFGPKKSLDV